MTRQKELTLDWSQKWRVTMGWKKDNLNHKTGREESLGVLTWWKGKTKKSWTPGWRAWWKKREKKDIG